MSLPPPKHRLTRVSLAFCIVALLNSAAHGQSGPPFWEQSGDTISTGDWLGTQNQEPLILKTDGTEHLRLLPDGKLGIGISTPQVPLHLVGDARFDGKLTTDSMEVDGQASFGGAQFDSITIGSASLDIDDTQGSGVNTISTTNQHEPIAVMPENEDQDHSGNLGVGTLEPERKLHVKTYHPEIPQGPGEPVGDHAGIRLENHAWIEEDQTKGTKWDIVPMVGVQNNELHISKASSKDPILLLNSEREIGVNADPNGNVMRIAGEPSGSEKFMLKIRGDSKRKLSLRDLNDGKDGGDYSLNFKTEGNKWNIGGGVLHLRGTGDPGALALSIFGEQHKSIILRRNGQVGIGTAEVIDEHKLSVKGSILATEIVVEEAWSDHVFLPDYELPTLEEEEAHIEKHGHLKDVPSEEEILKEGLSLGDLTRIQQRELEELYLHLFELKEKVEEQEKERKEDVERIEVLREQNECLRKQNELLKENLNEPKDN